MLVQDLDLQLIRPPVSVRRASAGWLFVCSARCRALSVVSHNLTSYRCLSLSTVVIDSGPLGMHLDFIYFLILIIVHGIKKRFPALLLALAAEAKKINPVSVNLETGFFGNLLRQVSQTAQIRVDDFFTPRAYQMRVRVRFVAVIPVASIRKANL
jgi:hypothetical protein